MKDKYLSQCKSETNSLTKKLGVDFVKGKCVSIILNIMNAPEYQQTLLKYNKR
ncbi:MAG: hypothetical protein P4L35_09020 [Ignavibacteriaceae bacterium]|nr:hypothetical protein [Ignavibacteriaceae bacterium]